MWHYTHRDIVNAFKTVGLKQGDVVFSHSNIGFFGFPKGERRNENAFETIIGAFFDVIGEDGTLVVPTYTYSFPRNEIYNPDTSSSTCGIFSEMLRKDDRSFRSHDPYISVSAIGKQARLITDNVPTNSYGIDSFFDRFYKADGVICNLNFDAGSTFIHYVERRLEVPYRFDKTFWGIFEQGVKRERRKNIVWARREMSDKFASNMEILHKLAVERNLYRIAHVGRGMIGMITSHDMFRLIQETLPLYPWFLTNNHSV